MRALWLDLNALPDTARFQAHGITRWYADARSTPILSSPFERGIYRVTVWDDPVLDPATFARKLSDDCTRWGGVVRTDQLAVHANIELPKAPDALSFSAWIIAFIYAFRSVRPWRETALVLEALKGGLLTPTALGVINGHSGVLGVDVLAEAYYTDPVTGQDMQPYSPDMVRSDLVNYGVNRGQAYPMYDAERLDIRWDGCAFTQQRLP